MKKISKILLMIGLLVGFMGCNLNSADATTDNNTEDKKVEDTNEEVKEEVKVLTLDEIEERNKKLAPTIFYNTIYESSQIAGESSGIVKDYYKFDFNNSKVSNYGKGSTLEITAQSMNYCLTDFSYKYFLFTEDEFLNYIDEFLTYAKPCGTGSVLKKDDYKKTFSDTDLSKNGILIFSSVGDWYVAQYVVNSDGTMNWYVIDTSEEYPDCRAFSYKMTPQEKVYYTPGSSDGPGSEEAGSTVDLAGKSYTYTASSKTYTVAFSSDGTFERSVSNLSTKDTGSWSVSGSTLTLKMTKGVEMEETFTASQTDSQLTLQTTSGEGSDILYALFGVLQSESITIELKS